MAKNPFENMIVQAALVIALTAIVLTGLAFTGAFSKELRTETTPVADVTSTALFNGTPVRIGTSGQYPFLQGAVSCHNTTNSTEPLLPAANYTVLEGTVLGGFITLKGSSPGWNNTQTNCTITYLADSASQGHADKFTTGLAIFATFLAIMVLSLVGKAIVDIFKRKKNE